MNFMHTFYPSLLKIPGFLVEFITPIIKVLLCRQLLHTRGAVARYDAQQPSPSSSPHACIHTPIHTCAHQCGAVHSTTPLNRFGAVCYIYILHVHVQARKGTRTLPFYTLPEYDTWREGLTAREAAGWDIKYYKGAEVF